MVILGEMLGATGHFRGQPRGVGSQSWDLDVSASQASRRGPERWSNCGLGARGREGVPFVDVSVAGDSGAGRGWEWGKVSGLQVPRRGTAVCYQLLGFGEAIFPL